MDVQKIVICRKNFGGKPSDPCICIVCSLMRRLVTICFEESEKLN